MNYYRNLVILFLFFNPNFGFSQNLQNLDLKYGFNKFKLGGSFDNYKKDLEFLDFPINESGVKYYKYIKRDVSIFGYKDIRQIGLGFYKNKLYTIDILLNQNFDENMFSTILSNLKNLFGYPTTVSKGVGGGDLYIENVNQWKSDKTLLGLNKVKCDSPTFPCSIEIFLVSQVIKRQIINDGF